MVMTKSILDNNLEDQVGKIHKRYNDFGGTRHRKNMIKSQNKFWLKNENQIIRHHEKYKAAYTQFILK